VQSFFVFHSFFFHWAPFGITALASIMKSSSVNQPVDAVASATNSSLNPHLYFRYFCHQMMHALPNAHQRHILEPAAPACNRATHTGHVLSAAPLRHRCHHHLRCRHTYCIICSPIYTLPSLGTHDLCT